MSIPESTSVSATPGAPTTAAAPFDRSRWLLVGVIGILGGYLTVKALDGSMIFALVQVDRYGPGYVLLFVSEAVFALAVTSFAFFFAPGPLVRRVLAVVLFVAVTVALAGLLVGRLSGTISVPGPTLWVLADPHWVVLAVGGLGWLIAAGARPIAYFTVLLALIVMPLGYVFALGDIAVGVSTLVQLGVSLAVAVAILFVSRPAVPEYTSVTASPAGPTTVAAPFDRWRWLLVGVIGIVGGYLTLSSVNGDLVDSLGNRGGYGMDVLALSVVQGIFAVGVTAFAFFLAGGPLVSRVIAMALFVVITVVLIAYLVARYWGALQLPGMGVSVVTNPYWVVLFAGGLGWLLAAGARPLAHLSLVLTFVMMPFRDIVLLSGVEFGFVKLIQLVAALAIAAVILLVNRLTTPRPTALVATS